MGFNKQDPVLHPALYQDPNLTPVNALYQPYPKDFIRMDEWRTIPLTDEEKNYIEELKVCPGTKIRNYFEVKMKWKDFQKYVFPELADPYFSIQYDNKVNNTDLFGKCPVLIKPRSHLFIKDISKESVRFWYITDGFMNADLQRRYLEAGQ